MSVIEVTPEVKYSLRVFRMLTHLRHQRIFAVVHNTASSEQLW